MLQVPSKRCLCYIHCFVEFISTLFVSSNVSNIFLLFSLFCYLFRIVLFSFHVLVNFPTFLLLLISSILPLCSKRDDMISVSLDFLILFCDIMHDVFQKRLSVCLSRMCTHTVKWNNLSVYVSLFGLQYCSNPLLPLCFQSKCYLLCSSNILITCLYCLFS